MIFCSFHGAVFTISSPALPLPSVHLMPYSLGGGFPPPNYFPEPTGEVTWDTPQRVRFADLMGIKYSSNIGYQGWQDLGCTREGIPAVGRCCFSSCCQERCVVHGGWPGCAQDIRADQLGLTRMWSQLVLPWGNESKRSPKNAKVKASKLHFPKKWVSWRGRRKDFIYS